ncbi:unnamed protein product [Urochloa humidicola]
MATLLRRLPSCVDAAPVRRGSAGARSRTATSPRGSRHGTASSVAAATRIPAARTTTPLDGAARPQAHLTRSLRDGSWLSVAGLRPQPASAPGQVRHGEAASHRTRRSTRPSPRAAEPASGQPVRWCAHVWVARGLCDISMVVLQGHPSAGDRFCSGQLKSGQLSVVW